MSAPCCAATCQERKKEEEARTGGVKSATESIVRFPLLCLHLENGLSVSPWTVRRIGRIPAPYRLILAVRGHPWTHMDTDTDISMDACRANKEL